MTTLGALTLPDGRVVDLTIIDGLIASIGDAGSVADADDLSGFVLLPALGEPHAHIDKALTADTIPNPTGDLMGAITAWTAASPNMTVRELIERAQSAVDLYLVHGVTALRTHVNVGVDAGVRAVEAARAVKVAFSDVIDMQIVSLVSQPLSGRAGAGNRAVLEDALDVGVDAVGGVPSIDPDSQGHLDVVLDAAQEFGLPIDLHVDETTDADVLVLPALAAQVVSRGLTQSVTASHCVSLGMQSPDVQARVAAAVAEAGIHVVANPQTNLYLQAWDAPTAPPRGITAIDALRAAGVNVAGGGDNIQDPFNPMGRGDPLETASLLVTAGHMQPLDALEAVSGAVRRLMGLPPVTFQPGDRADFTAVAAGSVREAIATGGTGRRVYRAGRLVAETTVVRTIHRER